MKFLINWLKKDREPDFIIRGENDENPYLRRWHLVRKNEIGPLENIYLHHFLRSDNDSALHDHPWWSISIILQGKYLEHLPNDVVKLRKAWRPWAPWRLVFRKADAAHRVEIVDGPVWTIFLTGRKMREWGFHCKQGWKHWKDFVAVNKPGEIGAGCGE